MKPTAQNAVMAGPRATAWLWDASSHLPGKQHGSVSTWLVLAPSFHPIWSWYAVSLIHLRPLPDMRPAVIHLDGATHELNVFAMDPEWDHDIAGPFHKSILNPGNFAAQLLCLSDAAATERVAKAVREICDGQLNPDTDALRQWVARFGDNMLLDRSGRKQPPRDSGERGLAA